jgi:PKD repeat protein
VDLVVSPDPTVILFAHKTSTYVIEEVKTVPNAWGPFTTPATRYLYWDLNLLTGALTRGMTLLPAVYASTAPANPALDQHWFDTNENIFRVWTNQGWADRLRVFAGQVTSAAIVRPVAIGSQAGLVGNYEGGHLVLDSFGKPLRQANGCFVNTVTQLSVVNLGTVSTRLEGTIGSVMAAEEIPKFSCVQLRQGQRAVLARSTDHNTRVNGIVQEDMYEGDISNLISSGVLTNSFFTFPSSSVGHPVFCGQTGQITLTPPDQGVLQIVGFVYDVNAIFVNIHQVVVLDDPEDVIQPPPPPPITFPIANFTATPTTGAAPLTVAFTNTATGATALEWDFVNDGFSDSTATNPSFTYAAPGTYTVRQRAFNSFGQDDEIKIGYITVTAANQNPLHTNLGLSFVAPIQIQGGTTFSVQVKVSNDGLANATNVLRKLVLRANNNSQVTIVAPPPGVVVTYTGGKTKITLPLVNINSGAFDVVTLQVAVQSNVNQLQIDGVASSPETDATASDNQASLTIEVRP